MIISLYAKATILLTIIFLTGCDDFAALKDEKYIPVCKECTTVVFKGNSGCLLEKNKYKLANIYLTKIGDLYITADVYIGNKKEKVSSSLYLNDKGHWKLNDNAMMNIEKERITLTIPNEYINKPQSDVTGSVNDLIERLCSSVEDAYKKEMDTRSWEKA